MGYHYTEKQRRFALYYLITGGRRVSFLLAGYRPNGLPVNTRAPVDAVWKNPTLQRLLRETVDNLAMAKNRLKMNRPTNTPEAKITSEISLIATAEEVLIYLTACMRGDITEEVLMSRLSGEGQQVIERLRKEIGPRDRTKAAELLAKRYGLLEYKLSLNTKEPVVFYGENNLED